MSPYIGCICIFLAASCWGLLGPVARFALEADVSPLEVAFWRCALGGLFFGVHAVAARAVTMERARDGLYFALFGAISVGGFFASYQYAVKTGGAALAAVLLYTAPAWVAVFSRVLLGEKLTAAKLIAVCMSLLGVACISFSGLGGNEEVAGHVNAAGGFLNPEGLPLYELSVAGIGFGLTAGLLYATHFIFTSYYLKRYTAITIYCYLMLFGALALLPFVGSMPETPLTWLVLLFLGLVCTYGAYLFYCAGLKRLAPTRAAILATLEPVVAIFAAWWIWGESFAALGWFGSVLVLGAVVCLILIPGRDTQ